MKLKTAEQIKVGWLVGGKKSKSRKSYKELSGKGKEEIEDGN